MRSSFCLRARFVRMLSSTTSSSFKSPNLQVNRIPSESKTLDTALIGNHPDLVLSHMKSRNCNEDVMNSISKISELRKKRNILILESDGAKSIRKTLSQKIGKLLKEGKIDEVEVLKLKVEESAKVSSDADAMLLDIETKIDALFSVIPNLLDDRVPCGVDESSNVVVHSWGDEKRKIGSNFFWHDEIGTKIGGLDIDAAARMSGSRFSVLVGSLARLERALIQYFLDFHTSRGYIEVSVPYIVSRSTLEGTGQLPKFELDLFKVNHLVAGEDAFLIPTAEVPVTNMYRDTLLNSTQLPIHHVCYSPSFRAEAGSYGRDTRGLLRQHQFHKVELVKICTPETSNEEHEKMTTDAEDLLKSLDLPFRRLLLCSGDIGFSARICYDIEVWLPGQQQYREISSVSNCYDFQSRRMSLRYRPAADHNSKQKKANINPHTLNGSGVAVGRALVAVLENNQNPDGSVTIPEKLRPYMGGITTLELK